ncbi:MAG: DNA methylase [Bacteroidetes bacterium]|nr:MAG: DNA methylase [Bacteroidota bacterium]REK06438.1 MAG: DNA methylase [Bacteroidota bacterium]REK33204.1 MAG: DNA methylase [Bacteroidota bacterium]REK47041.1 MAG: DNA methylase [Bacteroidota bacterium]
MKKLTWSTKTVKVKDLKPFEINPRKISDEKRQKLIQSLEKFDLAEIPAVNTDMKIIGGNQRIAALVLLDRGDELIDVRVPSRKLSEKEVKEYNLISNTHAGEWDFEILDMEFSDIDLEDIGFDIHGLQSWNLAQNQQMASGVEDDDFDVPLGGSNTDIVEGDIFDIGRHRLMCGSSTQTDTWERLMGQEMADLVITDTPYNVAYVGKTKDAMKIQNDAQSDGNFYQFLYDLYTALGSYTKKGVAWYVWHADSEGANFRKAMADSGIMVKQCLIWVKNSLVMGRQDYHWAHEPCLYGWKEGAAHKWYSDRKQTTVLNFDRPSRNAEHPTMKPVPLIAYQMGNSSKAGDIVCDGFGGSGTTMVAAHQMNRTCRMMELDPKYCQVIIDRMIKLDPAIEIKRNGKSWNSQKNS